MTGRAEHERPGFHTAISVIPHPNTYTSSSRRHPWQSPLRFQLQYLIISPSHILLHPCATPTAARCRHRSEAGHGEGVGQLLHLGAQSRHVGALRALPALHVLLVLLELAGGGRLGLRGARGVKVVSRGHTAAEAQCATRAARHRQRGEQGLLPDRQQPTQTQASNQHLRSQCGCMQRATPLSCCLASTCALGTFSPSRSPHAVAPAAHLNSPWQADPLTRTNVNAFLPPAAHTMPLPPPTPNLLWRCPPGSPWRSARRGG